MDNNKVNGNGRIEALRERERQIRAAIATEQMKRLKREKRETEKLQKIVGTILLAHAAQHSDFEVILKQTLQTSEGLPDADRNFLRARGWLPG